MDNKNSEEPGYLIKKRTNLCTRNWNRTLTAFLAFVVCFSMFTVVIVEIYYEQVNRNSTSKNSLNDIERILEPMGCTIENGSVCKIHCLDIHDSEIEQQILRLPFEGCLSPEIILTLEEINFAEGTIKKGWLSNLSMDVQELTLESEFLRDIGESAFAGAPFEYLQTLVIVNSRIRNFGPNIFLGSKVETLEIRCNSANVKVELNALGPIANYLTTLQFSNCLDDFQAVRNITGADTLFNKLIQIDLRYNAFDRIQNRSFIGTPQVVALYLSQNNIDTVELEAFKGIERSIQLLSLKDNKLSTLPNGVFDEFKGEGQIDIGGNPWNCNCDLVWLKEFYIRNFIFYFANGSISFVCTEGDYSEVEFCPTTNTVPDELSNITESSVHINTHTGDLHSTTTMTTNTTTESPIAYIYLDCKDLNISDERPYIKKTYSHQVKVRNGSISYKFYQLVGQPNFELIISSYTENAIENEYLLWINGENSSDYGCVGNIEKTVQLDNLQYGNSYTICLLKDHAETVAPFDCTSLNVPMDWDNTAWIVNKNIPIVIGAVVGITVGVVIITSIIIFYTIRQNPKLIKGNKRVVIVKNKAADALVMPSYTRQPYTPPSVYTNSEGYLTPRHKMYERINERRFRHLNAITEKYYNDFPFTRRPIASPRSEALQRRSICSGVYEPPPLPPNHPSETLKKLQSRPFSVYK